MRKTFCLKAREKVARIVIPAALAGVFVCAVFAATAEAVTFRFDIPRMPAPPKIIETKSWAALVGGANFTVQAKVEAQLQQRAKCDKLNQDDCSSSDWYFIADPGVTPNPPDIKKVTVYYYINADAQHQSHVDMTLNPGDSAANGTWSVQVPIDPNLESGDALTYYIVAIDGAGNVVSQEPDPIASACPGSPQSWNPDYSTPATDNCAYETSYNACGVPIGTPIGTCPNTYTQNTSIGDTCGEPNALGTQQIMNIPKVDIKGISAAADTKKFCVNVGLGASPPDQSDAPPIEMYLLYIYNPDKFDDNPADPWVRNAYVMTFAPEVVGTDQSLVRALWDGECVTDPNVGNPLNCKLVNMTSRDDRLNIGYNDGLKFIVDKTGTGDLVKVPWNLIGGTSKTTYVIAGTGEINLSGANAFWYADKTQAMAFKYQNQVVSFTGTPCGDPPPSPPYPVTAKCSVDGNGGTSGVCPKSASMPPQNKCVIKFPPSLDKSFITEYRVFKNTTSSFPKGATPTAIIPANATATEYVFTDTVTELDGTKYYYFITSRDEYINTHTGYDCDTYYRVDGVPCTVEDWVPPDKPTITCATPRGTEKKLQITITLPKTDPSLSSFIVKRDGVALNATNPMPAQAGVTGFSWTDSSELTIGQTYSYTVTAKDLGDNTIESDAVTCKVEDLKAPAQVGTAIGSNLAGKLGVHLDWQASPESDLGGYNVYWCRIDSGNDCTTDNSTSSHVFTKFNTTMIDKAATSFESNDNAVFPSEGQYCFYVEACDTCNTQGTCQSNNNNAFPNCSGFPTSGRVAATYVKCFTITIMAGDNPKPAFPANVTATPLPEGGKIKVTWTANLKHSDGSDFTKINGVITPQPTDITGYKIMRGPVGQVPVPPVAPVGMVPYGASIPTEFIDNTVLNGQIYAYSVYAVNSSGSFSENGSGGHISEAATTPLDIEAPSVPTMNAPTYTVTSCSPNWGAVSDKDPVSYKVYRCEQTTTNTCASSDKFTLSTVCSPGAATTCADNSVNTDHVYKYCVTASDMAMPPNESAVYPAGSQPNCAVCIPSTRPRPVTGTTPVISGDNFGTLIYWHNSPDDNHTSGGVNIYRCADAACSAKTLITGKACADLPASIAAVMNIGFGHEITLKPEPAGSWYYGVTFQNNCGDATSESSLIGTAISAAAIVIPPPPPTCDGNCITISSCSNPDAVPPVGCAPLTQTDVSSYNIAHTGLTMTPKAGAAVYLINSTTGAVIGDPAWTDANGNFEMKLSAASVPPGDKYSVVIEIPAAEKAGVPFDDPATLGTFGSGLGSDVALVGAKNITLSAMGVNRIASLPQVQIPKSGQGRSEIGNINCDSTVDLKDFLIWKTYFSKNVDGTASGAPRYADINQDGVIDLKDFLILKKNFGKQLDGPPTSVPDLCKQ